MSTYLFITSSTPNKHDEPTHKPFSLSLNASTHYLRTLILVANTCSGKEKAYTKKALDISYQRDG